MRYAKGVLSTAVVLGVLAVLPAQAEEAGALVAKVAEGDTASGTKLREMGTGAIQALRDFKSDKSEALDRVRSLLTDIAVDTSKMEPDSAALVHELAREEGKGKRYTNAEKLYRRGEQLYDTLKDDADRRKDKAKSKEYSEKQKICDRMKDKAGHKAKGDSHTGLNLGFVRVGKDHDMSDAWE